jgi:hypothetical protein
MMAVADRDWVEVIAEQIGSGTMPDNARWTNRFTVHSASSKAVYTVAQQRCDGLWGCSCPGWLHHRKCKHLKDILHKLSAHNVLADAVKRVDAVPPASVVGMMASARSAFEVLGGIR